MKIVGLTWASLVAQMVKNLLAIQETQVQSLDWGDPLKKKWQPTPVLLPVEFHGQRILAAYSSEYCKKSDMIEGLILDLGLS